MTTWSERRWWHYVVPAVVLAVVVGGLLFFTFDFTRSITYDVRAAEWLLRLAWSAVMSSIIAVIVTMFTTQSRIFDAYENQALALIGLDGRVLKAGLNEIKLRPWPFRKRYAVKKYPTAFSFLAALNPITTNPKVIPLTVEVTVELADHAEVPEWFLGYLQDYLHNPARFASEFRRQAFEIFQHRLPQDLADRLNPYDGGASIEALRGFTADRLSLPFPFKVKNLTLAMAD